MTVEQVYKNMDSDYASVKDRLQNDALIEKFLIKFLADESYTNIFKNLEAQNLEEAFRAAHTLKGVCQNLGLDRLYKSSYDAVSYTHLRRLPCCRERACICTLRI